MRKKLFITAIALATSAILALPLAGAGKANKRHTIGVVIPCDVGWCAAFHEGFRLAADQAEAKAVFRYDNYKADDELKAVRNFIAMHVDAISVASVNPVAAEYSCRLANEAKIPIQITESGIAEGKGKPFAEVGVNWFEVYRTVARGLRKDVEGDLSLVWVQGIAGTPRVRQGIEGFRDEINRMKGIKFATDVRYGNDSAESTLPLMKSVIESGVMFNVAVGSCQEITEGIIQAVKEEKVDRKSVTIVTVDGGPLDVENFKDGDLDYCLGLSPGLLGMICASNIIAYLDGGTYHSKSYSPMVWCSGSDWERKLIPWGVDQSWMPVVDVFMKTGLCKPELKGK